MHRRKLTISNTDRLLGGVCGGIADYLDIDGNLLITNDPYLGATGVDGKISFANTSEPHGLRVRARG